MNRINNSEIVLSRKDESKPCRSMTSPPTFRDNILLCNSETDLLRDGREIQSFCSVDRGIKSTINQSGDLSIEINIFGSPVRA